MSAATTSEIPLIAPDIVTLIPYASARRLRALAVAATPSEVTVLLPSASNIEAVTEIENITGRTVVPIESSSVEILSWLDHLSGTIDTNDLWLQQRHIASFARLVDHCLNVGQTDAVLSLIDRALEFAPYSAELWLLKARVATQRSHVIEALTVATQIAPNDRRVLRWIHSLQDLDDTTQPEAVSLPQTPASPETTAPFDAAGPEAETLPLVTAQAESEAPAVSVESGDIHDQSSETSIADASFHGARELSGVTDIKELVRRTALWLHTISQAASVSVYVNDDQDWIGWSTSAFLQTRMAQALPKNNRLAAQVVQQGIPIVITETTSRQEDVGALVFETGIRSFAILPLRSEENVGGLVYLNFNEPDSANEIFGDELGRGIELLVNTAGNVASAIEHKQDGSESNSLDPLTNAYVLAQLERMLSAEVERARRYRFSVSLISLDIDDFSSLNTLHGREFGDEVLRGVTSRIRSLLRASDVLARRSDDEFMLMLPQTTANGAAEVSDRLEDALSEGFEVGGKHVSLLVSIGIASYPDKADDSGSLMAAAEVALYRAKAIGYDKKEH